MKKSIYEGEIRKLYYLNSDFKKTEIEEYNKHRDDLHNFCEENNIEWRVWVMVIIIY